MPKIAFRNRRFILTALLLLAGMNRVYPNESPDTRFYSRLSNWTDTAVIDSLKNYIELFPDYQPAYLKLEEQLFAAEQSEEIRKYFRRFTSQNPNYQNAQWMLGRYFKSLDQPDKSLLHFENAIDEKNTPIDILYDYQDAAFHNDQRERAEQFLRAIDWSEQQQTLIYAQNLMLNEQYDDAIHLFQKLYPFDDFFLDQQFYRALYNNDDPAAAFQIAHAAQYRAEQAGSYFYHEFFYLAAIKCRYWQDHSIDLTQDIQLLQSLLDRCGNIRVQTQLAQLQAYIARQNEKYDEAIYFDRAALQFYLKSFNWRLATRCYQDIAFAYYMTNRNVLALQTLEESLQFADKINNYEISAWAWRLYGVIYRDLGLYKLSARYFDKAKQAALKTTNPLVLDNIDMAIVELEALQAPPQQAAKLYAEWLTDNPDGELFFPAFSLAQRLEEAGDFEGARIYYAAALHSADVQNESTNKMWAQAGVAGLELKTAGSGSAPSRLQHILKLAHELDNADLISFIQLQLGQHYYEREEYDNAIQSYRAVIEQSERKRDELRANELAIGFLSDRQEAYQRLAECYFIKLEREKNPDYMKDIFHFEELMHARALKDDMNRTSASPANTAELENYHHLCRTFQQVQKKVRAHRDRFSPAELDSLLSQLQIYKHDIVSEKIRLGNLDTTRAASIPPPQLADIQQKLTNQTALLYHITDRVSFALVIQPDTSLVVPLSLSATELDSLISIIMSPFHNINDKNLARTPFHADAAFLLYKKLIKPIEHHSHLLSQILIIPAGSLGNLPFDILLKEKPAQASYTLRDYPDYADAFLSHNYEFYYCPSTFILLHQPSFCSPAMLIVADPFKGETRKTDNAFTLRLRTGWRFDPLPYAHVEAASIKKLAPKSRIIKHDEATEKKISSIAARHGIVHIASHAFVDTTFDIFSGLALAYDKENDGLLMGFEIADSNFPCNLVTLSACETGRGKLMKGEGVLGLPRQFLLAGSRSVIMSKWKVDDAFTSSFMPKFYRHFLQEGHSKVSALTKAKREILADINSETDYHYQHPFFWAAFNLYGDAGSENQAITTSRPRPHYLLFFLTGFIIAGVALFIFSIKRKVTHQGTP